MPACNMTRAELQRRLQESAFGRNQVIFDAYFRWESTEKKQPRCATCDQPIGLHSDAPTTTTSTTSSAVEPLGTAPSPPVQQQQQQQYSNTNAYGPSVAAGAPNAYGSPPPQSPNSLDAMLSHPGPAYGYPPAGNYYQPVVAQQPVFYNQYAPPILPAQGVVLMPPVSPIGAALPTGLVLGTQADTVTESYYSSFFWLVLLFIFFALSSGASAIGLLAVFDSRSNRNSSSLRSDSIYSWISCAVWTLLAGYYAYRCRKIRCVITKGSGIESHETMLLTFWTSTIHRIAWSEIDPAQLGVIIDALNNCCACSNSRWARLMLRGTTDAVVLARVSLVVAEFEIRSWGNYFTDALARYRRN